MIDRDSFLYPHYSYQGEFTPAQLVFNANLQEFSKRTAYICNLGTGGKLSAEEVYQRLETLWDELTRSKQQLGIGDSIQDDRQA